MDEIIAKTEIMGRRPGGQPFLIVAAIGKPYLRAADPEEWAWPVSLCPLYKDLSHPIGSDSLQALCLGAARIIYLLEGFREKGGSLSYKEGGEFALEAYAFGAGMQK